MEVDKVVGGVGTDFHDFCLFFDLRSYKQQRCYFLIACGSDNVNAFRCS